MRIESRRRAYARRIGVGTVSSAIVTATLLIANPAPAGATGIVLVPAGDIRGDEATYAGWHQGYEDASLAAGVTADGLELAGQSQIINGYADNDKTTVTDAGMNAHLDETLPGASYDVTAGSAYFQVPLFVDADGDPMTDPSFTTLRPAAAASGDTTIAAGDQWVSSKTINGITADVSYPLSTILTEIEAHDYKTLAFGVLTTGGSQATVKSITWQDTTFKFTAAPVTAVTVTNGDVRTEETAGNYAEWHQGYENAGARQQVTANGLVLAGRSQVIKGFSNSSNALNNVNANLQFVLPEASYTVAAGSDAVFFQVPVKFNDGSGLKFTTLRNSGESAGTHGFDLADQWQSSKDLDGIPANTDAALGDIIAALGSYKTIGVGVLTNPGDTATVTNLTFGTKAYTFAEGPQSVTSSVVPVRDIAADESVYAGWHQGADDGVATATTDSKVLNLGALKSQVIKGYENNSSTLDQRNVNLAAALTGASYKVESGSVYFQVPLFVEDPITGDTTFTTLRPAAAAATGINKVDISQQWVSSKTVGDVTAGTEMLLGDILSEFTTYKVLGFGVFTDDGGNGAVSQITWDGAQYSFTGNRSPKTGAVKASTTAGNAVSAALIGTDADGDAVTFTAPSSHGVVKVTGSTLKYTPAAGYVGSNVITYTAKDALGASKTGTVTVKVAPVKTELKLSSVTGTAKKTFIKVTPVAKGAVVNGAKVDIRRAGKAVASGKVSNGSVRLLVGTKLKKGSYTFTISYKGTATSTAKTVKLKVVVR